MRIAARGAGLGHLDFDGSRRLLLGQGREKIEGAGDDDEDDDQDCDPGHGFRLHVSVEGAFGELQSRCIALSKYGFSQAP